MAAFAGFQPVDNSFDIVGFNSEIVFVAQKVLKNDLQRERKFGNVAEFFGSSFQAVIVEGLIPDFQRAARIQVVFATNGHQTLLKVVKRACRDKTPRPSVRRAVGYLYLVTRVTATYVCATALHHKSP